MFRNSFEFFCYHCFHFLETFKTTVKYLKLSDHCLLHFDRPSEVVMYDLLDSSSSSSSSNSEDELNVLLLVLTTTPSQELGSHVNLEDKTKIDCKLFRLINRDRVVLDLSCSAIVSITVTPQQCSTITRILHLSKWHVFHSHGGFTDIAAQISLSKSMV